MGKTAMYSNYARFESQLTKKVKKWLLVASTALRSCLSPIFSINTFLKVPSGSEITAWSR